MFYRKLAKCLNRSMYLQHTVKRTCLVGQANLLSANNANQFHRTIFPSCGNQTFVRQFSTSNKPKDEEPSPKAEDDNEEPVTLLMDIVPRGMPNIFHTIKNFFIVNFFIRSSIDKAFNFKSFLAGAKHAFLTISTCLANNQLDQLVGLVDEKALEEIRANYQKLSLKERQNLQIHQGDIVLSFAHHIDIDTLREDFTGTRKHIVRIFLVFDCIRNLESILKEKAQVPVDSRSIFREMAEHKYICNYEFKREYIEGGAQSDWIVTKLLHISERDLIRLTYFNRSKR